jgi:hypothetical protein
MTKKRATAKKMAAATKKSKIAAKAKPKKVYQHWNCHLCLAELDPKKPDHVCTPVTERELLAPLNEDFQEAFAILKQRASALGDQKIYNNARAIMFSRRVCYMFMRPKKSYLELCFFLPRREKSSLIHSVKPVSKTRFVHTLKLIHSDQVEMPLTNWIREAFEASN